ncbi:MAG TPA: lysophospholipase, partial [Chloroflexia bacterium]|nr:lysophospholipase [Chloroflexia bacterium]
ARAVVAVVHGVMEHSGRYTNVVDALVPRGYAVYALDLRGHGRSPGQRAFVNSFDEFRADVHAFLAMVRGHELGLPLFLLGHSMGGLIVLSYVLHENPALQGVIASGPALANNTSPVVRAVGQAVARVAPRLGLSMKKSAAPTLSRDLAVGAAYLADPLVPDQITVRLGAEIFAGAAWTAAHAAEFRLPLLLLHGGADPLVPPEGSRRFFAAAGSADKTFHEYPGSLHEIFNETNRAEVLADVAGWLDQHLDATASGGV